ncbi:MAG: aspartate aminotransferase family protein [Anaerolineaceae bacterium]|nr:aspartate aminotransferase family protein [Anaerolineaceae bacterium]
MNPVIVKTQIPGPKSRQSIDAALEILPLAQYAGLFGITLKKGQGIYLTDHDDNVFMDFLAGASAVSLGYARQEIIETYQEAASQIQHSCFPYSPNDQAVKFAKKLIEITPGDHKKKVLFGLSGSDSVDAAIKIAQRFTGKPKVLSFRGAYHGSTGFSISANGFVGLQTGLFLGENFVFCDFPRTEEEMTKTLINIEQLLQTGQFAALITETIQGDGGNVVAPPNFHQELWSLVKKYEAVHIVDEVQSGVGRSGKWWEIENFEVIPDILCTAKAITSGYIPMSACIARAEMADTLGKAQHLFTYSGHPPSAAIGLKVIEIIERENLINNALERGAELKEGLQKLVVQYPFALEVRGLGLHIGFEVYDKEKEIPLGGLFAFRCVEKGLYPGYFGSKNEVMRLHPPLIINKKEMEFAIAILTSVVEEWHNGTFPQSTLENYRQFGVGLGTD